VWKRATPGRARGRQLDRRARNLSADTAISCFLLLFLASTAASAKVVIESRVRQVSRYGEGSCIQQPVPWQLFDEQETSSSSGHWNARVPATSPSGWSWNSAGQHSFLDVSGGEAARFGGLGTASAYAQAGAHGCSILAYSEQITPISRLEVQFTVDRPTPYRISGRTEIGPFLPSADFAHYSRVTLTASGGELLQCSEARGSSCGSPSHAWGEEAVLAPGTYTLEAHAEARAASHYLLGKDADWNWILLSLHPDWATAGFDFELELLCEGEGCFAEVPTLDPAMALMLVVSLGAVGAMATGTRRRRSIR